ncbi:MAG: TIGR02996 domain-containing protein, partial [Gemmataceae bacterium]|nr:TIGR02996 domain-containing protein [Gemmataceae bacterium]
DDSAFLAALADGDDDTFPVYADWLEDNGHEARAAFLRAQEACRRLTHRHKAFLPAARRAVHLGSVLPQSWLARVNRPRLPGTVWAGTDSGDAYYVWRFLGDGLIRYSSPTGDFESATYRQVGPLVLIETNFHYASYEGWIAGRILRGWAANVVASHWTWDVRLATERKARADAPYRERWNPRRRRRS